MVGVGLRKLEQVQASPVGGQQSGSFACVSRVHEALRGSLVRVLLVLEARRSSSVRVVRLGKLREAHLYVLYVSRRF